MEVTINYNGQAVAVEVTLEVYEFLKAENLSHEQRRHWDGREFDEYIVATEGVGIYGETPEEYLCRMEMTWTRTASVSRMGKAAGRTTGRTPPTGTTKGMWRFGGRHERLIPTGHWRPPVSPPW